MYYKVRRLLWWFRYRNIIAGFINILKWLPIIYRDRHWDFVYIFDILQFKLELMEKYYKTSSCLESPEKIVKSISDCRKILDRIIDDDYIPNDILEWPNTEENRKKILETGRVAAEQYNADIMRFFTKMAREIQNWWD